MSPRDPTVWAFYTIRAWARISLGDYEAAVSDARSAIRHPAAQLWPHSILASALSLLGKREEAKIALDNLLEINPEFTPDDVMAGFSPLNPEALMPLLETWLEGLRKTGLVIPEKTPASD